MGEHCGKMGGHKSPSTPGAAKVGQVGHGTHNTHDLELDGLPIQLNRPDLKVHANGGDVRLSVRVIRETQQQTTLTHATVTYQQELEEKVAAGGVWREGREGVLGGAWVEQNTHPSCAYLCRCAQGKRMGRMDSLFAHVWREGGVVY